MRLRSRAGARELGELMRSYRKKAGLTLRDLSPLVDRSLSHLHRLETGERAVTSELEFTLYLSSCGVSCREIEELINFCRDANDGRGYWLCSNDEWMPDSLRTLIFHEANADRVVNYQPDLIPGLLQVESYIHALFRDENHPDDVRQVRVDARLKRQSILFGSRPGKFTFIINERALRLEVGDYRIMTEQLLAMLLVGERPNISIRVLPANARHRALFGGPFSFLDYDECKPLVYVQAPIDGFIIENQEKIEQYRDLLRQVVKVAFDEEESRVLIAKLADEYDRTEGHWDDARRVADEQL
ncbi:helix-turn-helix transcriptional regulator [Alloactinosynnema sp. L-07]|uniref:helix-turn-helix domain-containing protein n=1 Tax=Alloactinosynnema sp. L-07 TaxID=1653480 RepID=UPI00155F73F2|nr:helix-turn-helix transcriptional regulator [Alloactinosynnema sp. L-07]